MIGVLAVALVIIVAGGIFAVVSVLEPGGCRTPDGCSVSAGDDATFVATRPSGALDATVRASADGSASLVTLRGRRLWRASTGSEGPPRVLAAGDLSGDGVTDYVLGLVRRAVPERQCGREPVQRTAFEVVDGRTGRSSSVLPPLDDICWNKPTFSYPTEQWTNGTVYITDFTAAYRGAELVAVPYYAREGTVWNLAQAGRWQQARAGAATSFPWPSTPRFDQVYNAANPSPCAHPVGGGPCWVEDSHVANAVTLPGGGFFALTSARAVIYRPDLTPTSDTTWFPGGDQSNGGRNYGLVEAYRTGAGTFVDLIGGCSVRARQRAMLPEPAAEAADSVCGVTRHVERFAVDAGRITRHESVYYGYAPAQGPMEGRVEYPAHARAPLGGPGSSWTAYNVLRGGAWSAQVLQGPMTTTPLELSGWYVWDAVPAPGGSAVLLATRMAKGTTVPSWSFDVLRWDGARFRAVQHVDDAIPALVSTPSTPAVHDSEGPLASALVRDRRVLVVDRDGRRAFVPLSGGRS